MKRSQSLATRLSIGLVVSLCLQLALTGLCVHIQTSTDQVAHQESVTRQLSDQVRMLTARASAMLGRINLSKITGQRQTEEIAEDARMVDEYADALLASGNLTEDEAQTVREVQRLCGLLPMVRLPITGTIGGRALLESRLKRLQLITDSRWMQLNEQDARSRNNALYMVLGLAVANLLFIFIFGRFFVKSIVDRLKVMTDNTIRFANGQPLHPAVPGTDELCALDNEFRVMAKELKQVESRQKVLINNARDVLCSFDDQMRFTAVSPSAATVFGRQPETLIGRTDVSILTPSSSKLKETMSQHKRSADVETAIARPDGSTVETAWSIRWSEAERSYVCVVNDNSRRKEGERRRKQILEMVSHDLRSPLTSVNAFHAVLDKPQFAELNDKGAKFLGLATQNTDRMLNMLNDLLDAEMLQSGMLRLAKSQFDAAEVVSSIVASQQLVANEKSIELRVQAEHAMVVADRKRLEQILLNLLSNAIKFSPTNSQILVSAVNQSASVSFAVQDFGRGIPMEAQTHVFSRYGQVLGSDARIGSGVGLWICKSLVELHGGTIKVESDGATGTTFSFTIPKSADG